MSSEEFVKRLMTGYCPTGPLVQPFVIEALSKYSEFVIKAGAKAVDSPLLNGEAWVQTAEWVKKEIDRKYKVTE